MVTVIDTEQWPEAERHARWQEVLSGLYVPLRVIPGGPVVRGRLTVGELDRLRVVRGSMAACTLSSRRATGPAAAPVNMTVVLGGSATVRQGGREAHLTSGDLALLEPGPESTVEFSEGTRSMTVTVPPGLLGLSPERVRAVAARRVAGSDPAAAATAGLLEPLADRLGSLSRRQDQRVADALVHLVWASLACLLESLPQPERSAALRRDVVEYVERRLGDVDLGPATIAAAHHVSVRQVQRAFEEAGETLTGVIRSRRLDAARTALADPSRAGETITDIALRCGMTDLAGFSRRFRAEFGVAPREFRRRHLGPAFRPAAD